MKVDFIIVGAMKAGTTTFYKILKDHPEISFSKVKETHYFSETTDWRKDIDRYHKFFNQEDGKIYGEASPPYTSYPLYGETWKSIYEYNSEMKIIYIVRDPFERSVSHYMHFYERGHIDLPIEEAFQKFPEFLNNSRYYFQIKPYIEKFGREQVLLIDFDDYLKDKEGVLKNISSFLKIKYEGFLPLTDIHANKSIGGYKIHRRFDFLVKLGMPFVKFMPERMQLSLKKLFSDRKRAFTKKPELPPEARRKLTEYVEEEIPFLEKLLNKDLNYWLK